MPKYRVHFVTHSTAWMTVDVPEGSLRRDVVREADYAIRDLKLCPQCEGGEGYEWDLDLCDGWEPYTNQDGRFEIEKVD